VGWNDSLSMIMAEQKIWEKLILVSHFLNIEYVFSILHI
jgi:hypothetical protein